MQIVVKGKQVDVGDALRAYIEDRLGGSVGKYFDDAIESSVVISRQGTMFRADCSVHVGSGIFAQSQGQAGDARSAFDDAAEKVEKQLRRYKRRLRSHHEKQKAHQAEAMRALTYVLAPEEEQDEAPEELNPVIIAETTTDIPVATVGEAVMRLDLGDAPALLFRNSASGGLNLVYRRPDGNIGWVDPQDRDQKP